MSALATYLWKEWRDQRATVFGILGVALSTAVFRHGKLLPAGQMI